MGYLGHCKLFNDIFKWLILLPISFKTQFQDLRLLSILGVFSSIFVVIAIVITFFNNKEVVPSPSEQFLKADYFNFSVESLIEAVPFIIFLYMFQPNVPMLYRELNNQTETSMEKVILRGSLGAVFFYITAGIFGYLTFAGNAKEQI